MRGVVGYQCQLPNSVARRIQTMGFCCRNGSSAKGVASAGRGHSQLFDCSNSFLKPAKAGLNPIYAPVCSIRPHLISTLHQLAGGNRESDVILPSNVPYAYYMSASDLKTMLISQANAPQSVSRLALAIIVTSGWLILLCLNFRRRRKTNS